MIYPQRNKLETAPPGPLMQAALGPALTRVRSLSLLKWLGRGLLAGLGLAVLFLAIARLWPWYSILWWCLAAGGVSVLLALSMAWLHRPGWYSAAIWLDEAGLRERAVTALENIQVDTEISRCQRQDTLKQIRGFRVGDEPYPRPVKQLTLLGGLTVLVLALTLLPNPRQLEAERGEAVRRAAVEQSQKVAAVRKKIETANKANPLPEREKTIQALKELERQLENTRNLNQGLKAVSDAEDKLQKLQHPSASANSEKLAQSLQKQELTRALGQKMAAGDPKGSREETQKVLQKAAAMSKEQREAAAGELTAQAAKLDQAGANVMQSLAAGIRQGQAVPANALLNRVAAAAGQNAALSSISQGMT